MGESNPPAPFPQGKRARTQIILVRHGQTDWNLEGRYQGGAEVPLNAPGREQAERLAAELSGMRIDALYCSPLGRAVETARAIAVGRGLELHPDRRLREIDLGEWEGMLSSRIAELYPRLHRQWVLDPRPVRPPGGESIREVHDRVIAAVEEMARRHPGGTVCLVTHKVAIVAIRTHFLGLELPEEMGKMPGNGSWERLEVAVVPRQQHCCSAVLLG